MIGTQHLLIRRSVTYVAAVSGGLIPGLRRGMRCIRGPRSWPFMDRLLDTPSTVDSQTFRRHIFSAAPADAATPCASSRKHRPIAPPDELDRATVSGARAERTAHEGKPAFRRWESARTARQDREMRARFGAT